MLDNVSFFTFRPPKNGSYRLILYAKDLTQATKEGVYGGVCEYEVIMDGTNFQPMPFPPCVHTSWGLGDSASKYDMVPLQRGAIFSTVSGQAEVKFRLAKELRFTAKMKSNNQDEKALQGYVMHRVVGDQAIFTITAPNEGEFGLEIFANDPDRDGNSLFHAYQYLIICTEIKGPVEALPVLPPGYLGPQATFRKLGLSAYDTCGSLLADGLWRNTSIIQHGTTTTHDITAHLRFQQQTRRLLRLHLAAGPREPCYLHGQNAKPGMYKFQIYGLPYADTSESLPGVYNYLVNCHNTQTKLSPYPKQYGQWKEGCFLHEPLEGHLTANRPSKGSAQSFQYVYFKVDVPKAKSVAVVVGEDWTQLEQKNSESWEGEVFMEKHWGHENKAAVCANYGNVKASYSTLLEYSL